MEQLDATLFAKLAKEAKHRPGEFRAQDIANTAWAFATLGQADALLFTALAKGAQRRQQTALRRHRHQLRLWEHQTSRRAAAVEQRAAAVEQPRVDSHLLLPSRPV